MISSAWEGAVEGESGESGGVESSGAAGGYVSGTGSGSDIGWSGGMASCKVKGARAGVWGVSAAVGPPG